MQRGRNGVIVWIAMAKSRDQAWRRSSNRDCVLIDGRCFGPRKIARFHERARRSGLGPNESHFENESSFEGEAGGRRKHQRLGILGAGSKTTLSSKPCSSILGCPPKRLERRETLIPRSEFVGLVLAKSTSCSSRAVLARGSREAKEGEAKASTRNRNQRGAGARI
jgi:hypothetical protein